MSDINPLSYKYIQNSIRNFRQLRGDDFNWYDEPGTYWFKPIFYFYRSTNESEDIDVNNEGLLHPSWLKNSVGDTQATVDAAERKNIINNKFVSSAYNYLMRNDEEKRAKLLQQFITLLSNITSRSPWYFQEVGGLDAAVDHSEAFKEGKFYTDTNRQITFTLLPDAVDDRVGTLIDLYRSVCYSWKDKKEIVPSNLRKFDMGLYIYGSMIQDDNSNKLFSKAAMVGALDEASQLGYEYTPDTEIANAVGKYTYDALDNPQGHAHLYLEFHNCEIDLSSTKGGDTISNADGSERKYTLTINYDDCYVNRYNDFIVGAIGDILRSDIQSAAYGKSISPELGRKGISNRQYESQLGSSLGQADTENIMRQLGLRMENYDPKKMFNNMTDSLKSATLGRLNQWTRNKVGNLFLGNLYGTSFMNIARDIASGRIISTGVNELNKTLSGNLSKPEVGKSLYPTVPKKETVQALGNIYRSMGAVSNL